MTVAYGASKAVQDLSLRVYAAELVALLGPSGSGKTTLLHATAGFLDLAGGEIWIGERRVAARGFREPPEQRRVGLVFQSYALWPHMTVLETVAYPLRRHGVRAADATAQARELLERLGLEEFTGRRPGQLSGGQQQRVGLARALATEPTLFLFDEPTANLDSALRATFQEEIRRQQLENGAGALYVTHDPAEALSVSDRVAVMRHGRIVQVGSPTEIYERPCELWVAELTGGASVVEVELLGADTGAVALRLGSESVTCRLDWPAAVAPTPGQRLCVLLRPDWVLLGPASEDAPRSKVSSARYQGPHTDYTIESSAGQVLAREPGPARFRAGDVVGWTIQRAWLLPEDARAYEGASDSTATGQDPPSGGGE